MKVSILNDKLIITRDREEYIFTPKSILSMRFFSYGRLEIYTKTDELWFSEDHANGQTTEQFSRQASTAMYWFKNNSTIDNE